MARRALTPGLSVMLDYGPWSRKEREMYRLRARGLGLPVVLHLLDLPPGDLWLRLQARNVDMPPDTFPIRQTELKQ